eukprot:gene23827-30101_t
MPEALMCLVMMFPTMISKIVKSVRSEAVFFAWTLNFITLLTVIYVFNVTLSSPAFLSVSMPLSSLNMGIDLITAVLEETSTLLSSAPDTIKNALLDQ